MSRNAEVLIYRYYARTGGVVLFCRGRRCLRVTETVRFDVHTLKVPDANSYGLTRT